MPDTWVPTKWRKWYDQVLVLYIEGKSVQDIAQALGRHRDSITRLTSTAQFKAKYDELITARKAKFVSAMDILEQNKVALAQQMVNLATSAEKDSTKQVATAWCLERFPEFAPKNVPNVNVNTAVYQESPDDIQHMSTVADKMNRLVDILRNGNPNVIDNSDENKDTKEQVEHNLADKNTDTPRGDSEASK